MKTFTLIVEMRRPVGFIVDAAISLRDFRVLDRLSRGNWYDQPDLAERWRVGKVFADDNWAKEQRKRTPMIKPKGVRMAILES